MKLNAQTIILFIAVLGLVSFGLWNLTHWGQRPGVEGEFGQSPSGQQGQPGPQPGEPPRQEYQLPSVNTNLPLPNSPQGAWVKKQLGDVEIKYFSTAIIRGMSESGTDYFITLKNNGNSEATVSFSSDQELATFVPQCNLHFFSFQNPPTKIPAPKVRAENPTQGREDLIQVSYLFLTRAASA